MVLYIIVRISLCIRASNRSIFELSGDMCNKKSRVKKSASCHQDQIKNISLIQELPALVKEKSSLFLFSFYF